MMNLRLAGTRRTRTDGMMCERLDVLMQLLPKVARIEI